MCRVVLTLNGGKWGETFFFVLMLGCWNCTVRPEIDTFYLDYENSFVDMHYLLVHSLHRHKFTHCNLNAAVRYKRLLFIPAEAGGTCEHQGLSSVCAIASI